MAKAIEFLMTGFVYDNKVLSHGKVNFYEAGTTTRKNVFSDRAGSIIAPNPVTLDVNGRALVFGDGIYKIIVTDRFGKVIATYNRAEFTNASTPTIQDIQRTGNANLFHNSSFQRWLEDLPVRS